jgi:hypothetical protein
MGKASRRRRRQEESLLREVGVVYVSGPDGEEVALDGPEALELRLLMSSHCPHCSGGESHRAV